MSRIEGDRYEASFQRPCNYFQLDPQTQWRIDERLGILDWDGGCYHHTNISKCQPCLNRFKEHYQSTPK